MSYFILSCDGGGVRGALSSELISRLESSTPFLSKVDLFAGTSTGAFIALGLAVGLSPEKLLELYTKAGSALFTPAKGPVEKLLGFEAKYTNAALKGELEKVFGSVKRIDPHGPLSQIRRKVAVVAFKLKSADTGRWEPVIINNYSHESISIIDAALMSSAAPTYFPSYKGYIDGGVSANNPALSALALAASEKVSVRDIHLLSVGTGFVEHDITKKEQWGALKWIINLFGPKAASSHPLVSLFYDAEEELASLNCERLLGERFMRLNLKLKRGVSLDDLTQVKNLVAAAKKADLADVERWLKC